MPAPAETLPAAAEPPQPVFEAVLMEFQALSDYQERKAFYRAHPQLERLISPNNFPE